MADRTPNWTRRRWLAVLPVFGASLTAHAADGSLQATLVLASNSDAAPDRSLGSLDGALRRLFKFKHYKRLGSARTTTALPGKATMQLGHGNVLAVDVEDAGGGTLRAKVRWTKGSQGVLNTTVVLRKGTPAMLGGASHDGGKLIVALTAR